MTSTAFYAELCKLIDLPKLKNVTSLDLHIGVDEFPTVTVKCRAELSKGAEPITRRFMLEEIREPGLSTAQAQERP